MKIHQTKFLYNKQFISSDITYAYLDIKHAGMFLMIYYYAWHYEIINGFSIFLYRNLKNDSIFPILDKERQ